VAVQPGCSLAEHSLGTLQRVPVHTLVEGVVAVCGLLLAVLLHEPLVEPAA